MKPKYAVICGGVSSEREVSIVSGTSVWESLRKDREIELIKLDSQELPPEITPDTIVVSMLHGVFGEDGGFQQLLEAAGIEYVGSDARSSALTFDKVETKRVVKAGGVRVIDELVFDAAKEQPDANEVVSILGNDLVIKPVAEGSSVGVSLVEGADALRSLLGTLTRGRWMIEKRIRGYEFSVGVLDGKALGVVEIKPKGGVYDYKHKYTKGMVDYEFPARIDERLKLEMQRFSEIAYKTTGCRDFARVDLMGDTQGNAYFLEVNTLPGMTPTSLLPKSASCLGYDFDRLVREMILPAEARFNAKHAVHHG